MSRLRRDFLAAALVFTAAVVGLLTSRFSHAFTATLSENAAWKPQLVILIACDTLRADRLHCYGNERRLSPNIDHLAREGVLFERAFSQSNFTQPSFQSVMTGVYPPFKDEVLAGTPPTIASMLRAYGIDTAAFTGGGHLARHFGLDRGFQIYKDDAFRWLHATEKQAIPWLAEHARSGRRGFLFVHGYDCHVAYAKPLHFTYLYESDEQSCGALLAYEMHTGVVKGRTYQKPTTKTNDVVILDPPTTPLPPTWRWPYEDKSLAIRPYRRPTTLTDRDIERLRAAYDGCIRYADVHVGLLMSEIYALGLADKVLVVFMSDHGEQLMEADFWGHREGWAASELHVPLILWAPKALRPRRVQQVVEMTSLFPTILAAFDVPPPETMCATSLLPLATGQKADDPDADAFSGRAPKRSIRTRDWCLVETTDPKHESRGTGLFDLNADPLQLHDLSGDPSKQAVLADLRARLAARLRRPHL